MAGNGQAGPDLGVFVHLIRTLPALQHDEPQPIVTAQGRNRVRMPIVLPLSAIGRSHLGNPG